MKKILLISLLAISNVQAAGMDPLPSWQDGSIKQSIVSFVQRVTDKNNPSYVAPENRIATFDNDGTLWVEQPLYTQFIFAIARIKAMSAQHPEWKTQQPYSAILSGDPQVLSQLTMQDMEKILAVTHTGMAVEQFNKIAADWLATAQSPRFHRLYFRCFD